MFLGILWDNDGVLVDTEPLYLKATRETLTTSGIDLTEQDYTHHLMHGGTPFDIARSHGYSDEAIDAMRLKRNDRYGELLKEHPFLIDGVKDVLDALHGKLPMGIVSTSRRVHLDIIMDRTGLRKYFDFFVTMEDFRKGKPDPEPYLLGLSRLGLPASACLAIEDSGRGVLSAKAAGLTCFAIPNALTRENDFSRADRVLRSIRELPAFLH